MRKKAKGVAWPEAPSRFPKELTEFLSGDTYSLLIKGGSGSGKTILALTILGALKKSENILYVSTRTSPSQMMKNYPWTRKVFGVDSENRADPEAPRGGWETLVDARLDEPGIVFERITNVLMDKQAPTVVVDSWESLSDSMDNEALRTNIKVLQTWRERAGARFIFVGEDAANTAIDSVVEGVVVLGEQAFSGRRLREISLSKLHGVQISKPTYFFSLEGGVFHSFDRYRQAELGFTGQTPNANAGAQLGDQNHASTGFPQLDEELGGGYPLKSMAWIEMDARVDAKVVVAFLAGTIRDWAASGKSVVLQKSDEIDSAYVSQLRSSLGGRSADRIMVWGSASLDKLMDAEKNREDGLAGLRSKASQENVPVLSVVDWDKITKSTTPAGPVAIESLIDLLKRSADLTIVVARSNLAHQPLSGIVSTHIRIVEINGTVFAMSEKPWSELYAIVPERKSGNPGIRLERVV